MFWDKYYAHNMTHLGTICFCRGTKTRHRAMHDSCIDQMVAQIRVVDSYCVLSMHMKFWCICNCTAQSTTKSLQQQDTRWHQRLRCRPNSSSGTEFKQDQTKSYQFREAMRRGVDPRLEVHFMHCMKATTTSLLPCYPDCYLIDISPKESTHPESWVCHHHVWISV